MNEQSVYINKYLPPAILYFFLNGFLLPLGLLYTALLTPLFLVWLYGYRSLRWLSVFFILLAPYMIIHFVNGVEYWYYFKSTALLFTVFVFCIAFYQYLDNCHTLRTVYKNILVINAVMVVVCVIALFLPWPALWYGLWNDNKMSLGNINVWRLRMLTYEPSYYSTLFAPIGMYYLLKVLRRELPRPWLYTALVVVPLALSLSFGVILGLALSLACVLVFSGGKTLFRGRNLRYTASVVLTLVLFFVFLWIFFPENIFFRRISNVLSGKDLSFNGRTLDSFVLGIKIAKERSLWFGVGLGQVKLIGLEFFKVYYNNPHFTINDIGIPNNVGDILATFGLVGAFLKLLLEGWLFVKTRVYGNYYRLGLFLFIFMYQFTGSFIMNIAEYAIWILAFKQGLFPEFDRVPVKKSR